MSSDLVRRVGADVAARAAVEFVRGARSRSTERAYAGAMRKFSAWCTAQKLSTMPTPSTVARYVAAMALAKRRPVTIEKHVAAICADATERGLPSPRTKALGKELRGIRRSLGTSSKRKRPILEPELRAMLHAIAGDDPRRVRDRAVILLGWFCACRRSALVAFDVADIEERGPDLWVTIRRDKTDQEGEGRRFRVPAQPDASVCAVRAFNEWKKVRGDREGPLFVGELATFRRMSDKAVARRIQRAAKLAGLNPASFGGHSLRAGFVTQARIARKSTDAIQRKTGHESEKMLRVYTREAEELLDDAAEGIFTKST